MKSYGAWFGRLAMAGACLGVAGCGGGDVPNPDSDPSAAAEGSGRQVAMAPAAPDAPEAPANKPEAPTPAAKPDPSGPSAPSAPSAPAPPPSAAPAPGAEAEKPATEAPADSAKPAAPAPGGGDASGTDEMLRTAPPSGAAPGAPAPSSPGPAAPAPSNPGPAAPAPGRDERAPGGSSAPSTPGAPGGPSTPSTPGAPGGPSTPSTPGTPGGPGAPSVPGAPAADGRPSADGRPMGPSGGGSPGGPSSGSLGGSGGTGANRRTFLYPNTAVAEFLAALKDKNKDRLSEATAKRAGTEAVEKHQKIFSEIIDGSLSDEELDEMAKAFDGFQVVSILPAKSTGRIGVLVGKQGRSGDYLQRTVTCRKEDGIWKVVDISQMYDFKRTTTTRRRR